MKKVFALAYVLLVVLGIIWGSSFILIKRGLLSFTPLEVGAYRMFAAGIVLLPVFVIWLPKSKRQNFKWFFVSGLVGNGLPAVMFALAQKHITSSMAGVLNSLTPLFALLVGLVVYRLPFDRSKLLGVMVGLVGAMVLILFRPGADVAGSLAYSFLVILAAFFYGVNINLIKEKFAESRPMVIAAFPIVFMAIPSFFILMSTGFFSKLSLHGQVGESLGYLSILAIVGTALSLVLFNRLIQLTNAVFASLTTYIIPVVALGWGLVDGEDVGWMQVAGLLLILTGVLMVRKKGTKKPDNQGLSGS